MALQEGLYDRDSISDDDLELYRDALEFPDEVDDFIQRSLSSRSVVRTPSSKYRDKTIIKTLDDVTPQPQVLEEGMNESGHDDDVNKTNTDGAGEPPKEEDLAHQRSISSQICVSPSWSRAGDKKRRRKKDQKRQEKDQRDLEQKLEQESRKNSDGAFRREPRRLTKRPPPANSSRASSANGRMQRPSTASSFRSFWSNRSSRASSVQGSDTEGQKRVSFLDSLKREQKNGTWLPRMWPKKSKTKDSAAQRGHVSDSEAQTENTPRHSLHTVKKHGDLRSVARTHSTGDTNDQNSNPTIYAKKASQNPEISPERLGGQASTYDQKSKGTLRQPGDDLSAQKGQTSRSPRGVVIGPSSSKKRPAPAPVASNNESPGPSAPSRTQLASSRKSPTAEPERNNVSSPLDQSFFVKIPKTPTHDFDRSRENAGQTPKKVDQSSLQQRSPNISKKINRNPDSRASPQADTRKPRDLFEVVDLPRYDGPVTESKNQSDVSSKSKTDTQDSPYTPGKAVVIDGMPTGSSGSYKQDNKPKTTINFSRTARLRPSPLSGPPLLSPGSKDSATSNADANQICSGVTTQPIVTSPTIQGHHQLATEPNTATRTRRLSLDRFLRPGKAKKAAINDTDTPPAKQAILDFSAEATTNDSQNLSKDHLERQTSANAAPSGSDGKPKVARSEEDGNISQGNGVQKVVANDGNTPKPRRNSIDIINKFRPSLGKTEVKLKKKRPSSAGVNSITPPVEKPPSSNTRTQSASNSPLLPFGNVNSGHSLLPKGMPTIRNMRDEGNSPITRPVGKPWLGSDQISSSSSLLGVSSGNPGGPSRGSRPTSSGQRIAKMFVICCKCKFWHDMPSDAYAKLAFPTVAALKNKLVTGPTQKPRHPDSEEGGAGWSSITDPSGPQPNKMDDEARASTNLSGTSNHVSKENSNGMNNSRSYPQSTFSRFSFLNQSVIKCCWCDHRMSRTCCAGWTALVQLRERHH
ncbi:hypothetical protein MGYG_05849 [Nannizzia gypsea CBS 118893]|uniref:Uncharacterized protein n=1 Tax=Arthroderma gypseum (strain ATCC MYA-4604 / CBS 118893) TaxID=535722 RepID=E4UZR1_ARTGP|nr:hypothetical protein MGYG_05849 [Nannizzia gypsea CBS 118893]EFR02848.1 hypothetical protein MGYG_05849 [Nannizzia gypsea CBS 118893]